MSRRGGPLELAIKRAATNLYRPAGRGALLQQHPDVAELGGGEVGYASGAPVDFIGCHAGGRLLAVEAKSIKGVSLPCDRLRADQVKLMTIFHGLGGDVRLVVAFGADAARSLGEVYSIDWPAVAQFLACGWRASFSRTWARAVGLLLPVEHPDKPERRRVLWLDGAEHPARQAAIDQVEAERLRASAEFPQIAQPDDSADDSDAPSHAERPRLTADEWRTRLQGAVAEGIERQRSRPRRTFRRRTA